MQLGVSLARNSGIRPLYFIKGALISGRNPLFRALLITLKGILPLTMLAEPAVDAGLCPTPQQRSKPLCNPFLTLATRQEAAICCLYKKAFKACHVSMASTSPHWRPLTLHAFINRNREHFRASEGVFAKCQSESG